MTPSKLAKLLDGRDYSRFLFLDKKILTIAKESKLVIVYFGGKNNDTLCFRGAWDDEVGALDGFKRYYVPAKAYILSYGAEEDLTHVNEVLDAFEIPLTPVKYFTIEVRHNKETAFFSVLAEGIDVGVFGINNGDHPVSMGLVFKVPTSENPNTWPLVSPRF